MAAERSTADILDAAVHVREAARSATSGAAGVDGVLAALSEVMEYDHASLARWDPLRRRHTTLAGSYPDDATAYIETRLHHDPVFPVLRSPARGGLWLMDVPGSSWRRHRVSSRCCVPSASRTAWPSASSPPTAGTSAC